jgi:hypothetical protein
MTRHPAVVTYTSAATILDDAAEARCEGRHKLPTVIAITDYAWFAA